MRILKYSTLLLLLTALPACGRQLVEFYQGDGAAPDAGKVDAVAGDGVNPDAANADATYTEVAEADGGNVDFASIDGGNTDTKGIDAGTLNDATGDVPSAEETAKDAVARDGEESGGSIRDAPVDAAHVFDVPIVPELDGASVDVPAIDTPDIDVAALDVTKSDGTGAEVESIDLGSLDGPGTGPAIVINLGLASPFAIAATAGVTNTITSPITHINGDVVLTPNQTCNAVTVDNAGGFGLCGGMAPTISGTVITNTNPDTTTASAIKADLNAAFLSITPPAGPPAVGSLGGGTALAAPTTLGNVTGSPPVLGDNWFTPGVYTSITSILITGDVTLDGQGDPNAVFVFQSASTLVVADGAPGPGAHLRILLTNGAKASNVWWQVGSSATIGLYAEFQGNLLAALDITMKTGSTACGRSMAGAWVGGNGAYVFDSNVVSVPGNGCPL